MPYHPAIVPGAVAVVIGAASGIGLAAATRFAALGMKVALADVASLDAAVATVAAAAGRADDVVAASTDVSRFEEVERLREMVLARFGGCDVLMNNAGIEAAGRLGSPLDTWRRIVDVNLWGVIHGIQAFLPAMLERNAPALVINTGSKQGITTPPGNAPYNVSKAGVKVVTEALAHELRSRDGAQVTAHLLIPGFVYTGLTKARGVAERPDAAWTPEETVAFMLDSIGRGDFYILCPDNDVDRATDEKRIRWAADDIIQNRSALSRWDARYNGAFEDYMKG